MNGKIFLLDRQSKLVPLAETPYESEALLQTLLADYPDLLAGELIDSDDPRRWLLIKQESGIPGEEAGSGRWSVDHLFVDQDGIPTLVEVKRSSNTGIRRQVVGQLLEYAANAVTYWPVEKIRSEFELRCEQDGILADQALFDFLGPEADEEAFWQKVETNLRLEKIRLLFVADKIPSELQQIVEFLNRQMRETEVLAVEIRQFEGEGRQTLVPRVIGKIAEPPPSAPKQWDEASYLGRLEPADQEIGRRLLAWAKGNGFRVEGGKGPKSAGLNLILETPHGDLKPLYLYEHPVAIYLQFDRMGPRFQPIEMRQEFTDRVHRATGTSISPEKNYPAFLFTHLQTPEAMSGFLKALDWLVAELKR